MAGTLVDKVALVTGASRGIGRAIAGGLAATGCDVLLAARGEADLARAAAEIAGDTGRRAEICAGDLSTVPGVAATVARLADTYGRVDVLVNNAGATQGGDFLEQDDAVWDDGFALKFFACVRLCRALWPQLVAAHGSVINISGGFANTPDHNFMIGGAVNAAMTNFTKALANRGLIDDVNVNAIHPGPIRTERMQGMLEQQAARDDTSVAAAERQALAASGLRRFGETSDVASLAVYLAGPAARQIHGAVIMVDGGARKGL